MTQPGEPGDIRPVPSEQTWANANWAARVAVGSRRDITVYRHQDVWLIEVTGPSRVPGDDVDLALQMALAEDPRGVVCGLDAAYALTAADLALLGRAGRHVQSWPSVPMVFVCPDDARWAELGKQAEARFLMRGSSLLHAWSQIRSLPRQRKAVMQVPPDGRAARTARQFLTRTCADWSAPQHLASGPTVVSELVTNAVEHTTGPVDVHLAEHAGELRIGVRDHGDAPPVTRDLDPESTSGRGLVIVQALSRVTGALPAAGGGKLVWAVLAAEPVTVDG